MAKIDERFDIEKSADAAARYLKRQYKRYGSWDKALLAYNQGFAIKNSSDTKFVKDVRRFQDYYNKIDNIDNKYLAQKTNSKGYVNKKTKR